MIVCDYFFPILDVEDNLTGMCKKILLTAALFNLSALKALMCSCMDANLICPVQTAKEDHAETWLKQALAVVPACFHQP